MKNLFFTTYKTNRKQKDKINNIWIKYIIIKFYKNEKKTTKIKRHSENQQLISLYPNERPIWHHLSRKLSPVSTCQIVSLIEKWNEKKWSYWNKVLEKYSINIRLHIRFSQYFHTVTKTPLQWAFWNAC